MKAALARSRRSFVRVAPPERRGFGSQLIEQVLGRRLRRQGQRALRAAESRRFELATRLSNLPDQGVRIGL